jgi:Flp pilus assembly protein TadG
LAVCVPVVALLAFGTIDTCNMIYLKQSLTIAAYEGGRTAISRGADTQDVTDSAQAVLDDRKVKGATINVTPQPVESQSIGTFIEVSVTASCEQNSIFGSWFYAGRIVNGRSEFQKKY